MADIKIDQAKARIWKADVDDELDAVEKILNDVKQALMEYAGSNDTLIQGITKVGDVMQNTWSDMSSKLKRSQEYVDKAIKDPYSIIEELENELENLKRKIVQ